MELKVFKNKQGNALYYMKSVRKPGLKNPTKTKVAFLGYEEDLKKDYPDPIAHFKAEAKKLSPGKKSQERMVSLNIDLDERYNLGELPFSKETKDNPVIDNTCFMGHLPFSAIYHELEIDQFVKNRRSKWGIQANAESIFRLLIFGRLICPLSKLSTWSMRDKFFLGNSDFTDDDMYRSFNFFNDYHKDLLVHLNKKVTKLYGRDTSLMYYDVTNLFSEIDIPDSDTYDEAGNIISEGLRKRGCSKEHRPNPVVQIGLFIDNNGLPVTFGVFPGNNNDVKTFVPMIEETRKDFNLNKMIYVADKGMMSGTNIATILSKKQGYIISDSARKQNKSTEKWLFDEKGYKYTNEMMNCRLLHEERQRVNIFDDEENEFSGDDKATEKVVTFKMKQRLVASEESVWVEKNGIKEKVQVKTNKVQIAFWSRNYDIRAKIERAEAIKKAQQNGTVFNGHAANKYFKKGSYDSQTGELHDKAKYYRYLDEELIKEDEKYDGYYIIETNVVGTSKNEKPWEGTARFRTYDMLFELNREVTATDIIDMYRGLWEIEEAFKITKSYLDARPMFVRTAVSIKVHILVCFISLLMLKILEVKKLKKEIPFPQIFKSLRSAGLSFIQDNIYKSTYFDSVIQKIGLATGIDMSKIFYSKQEIRSLNNYLKNQ